MSELGTLQESNRSNLLGMALEFASVSMQFTSVQRPGSCPLFSGAKVILEDATYGLELLRRAECGERWERYRNEGEYRA
jgi:hypothetical protein